MLCFLNLHPPVSCLSSPQLTLPEGTQSRWGHSLTACRMDQSRIHATAFGGCPTYDTKRSLEKHPKLADTTVLEFGEQKACHTTYALGCVSNVMVLMSVGMLGIAADMQPLSVLTGLTELVAVSLPWMDLQAILMSSLAVGSGGGALGIHTLICKPPV